MKDDHDAYYAYMMGRGAAANVRPDPFFRGYDQMTVARENDQPGAQKAFGPLHDILQRYMMLRARTSPMAQSDPMMEMDEPPVGPRDLMSLWPNR